ncbi:hypothetical protein NPIL_115071 [Nephila pilipes]|uniref:Uncharacterized protein n=1 Tax=Nephila pilipes TaxID=299642 RepID=A0A8X6MA18_NEPPI|nr:hypothetical protein NPIL_115071 [Nephila pilipes]
MKITSVAIQLTIDIHKEVTSWKLEPVVKGNLLILYVGKAKWLFLYLAQHFTTLFVLLDISVPNLFKKVWRNAC